MSDDVLPTHMDDLDGDGILCDVTDPENITQREEEVTCLKCLRALLEQCNPPRK